MTNTIFIDGEEGTTGLQIRERLEGRPELNLITLTNARRKDARARREALNAADVAILCLPDGAASDAVKMIDSSATRVIDASTEHRVATGWIYGFPEMLSGHRENVSGASRVTNPGCYPTGAVGLIRPLVAAGILPRNHPVTINAVSGYSGGGKALIARMKNAGVDNAILSNWFGYGLGLAHKHVPEMKLYGELENVPLFTPSVGRFEQGMVVQVPLPLWDLKKAPSVNDIREVMAEYYHSEHFVSVANIEETEKHAALLDPEELNGTNHMRLYVFGNDDTHQALLAAQLDNLGKGASGQAVQCLNLMLGLDEAAGLD